LTRHSNNSMQEWKPTLWPPFDSTSRAVHHSTSVTAGECLHVNRLVSELVNYALLQKLTCQRHCHIAKKLGLILEEDASGTAGNCRAFEEF
jgi:hypothetical protein